MNNYIKYISKWRLAFVLPLLMIFLGGCSKDEELSRTYESAQIVGVKVNNQLYTPQYTDNVAQVVLPAGRDLTKLKLQLLVVNGELIDFVNNAEYDCRKPLAVSLQGADGVRSDVQLKIQSPPSLSSFIIEGLNIPATDVHFSSSSLIVQVPKGTNLSRLNVTMEFLNGTLMDFTNGAPADYTGPKTFKLQGVDGQTVYSYDMIITTEPVGPASVRSMTINGVKTDSVVVKNGTTLVPYIDGLSNFSSAKVELEVGFGNRVEAAFTGASLNLLSGANKVKITGSDGIEKEFTIAKPALSLTPVFSKAYDSFGFGANDLTGVAFSGDKLVVSNYSAVAPVLVGPNYYDLSGQQVGVLNKTGVTIAHSLRKVASDDKGAFLVVPLGLTDGDQTTYKWDNVTAAPVPYITYSKASLGVDYTPRSAGINISGDLSGDATIAIGMAQKTDVFVWTVKGGVLNTKPQRLAFPYDKTGFYWSVQPLPQGSSGFVGAASGTNFNGVISMNNTLGELHKLSGIIATDSKAIRHNGRIYLAYTAYAAGKGAIMRVCDITDGQASSYETPIFDVTMPSTAANANNTMDADMAVVNGKLHAVFACTNIGMRLYRLEK